MQTQKYSVNQHLIETLLSWVKSGEIAIPEIQRPFVWEASKVRDLMDSLYRGFPVGYIIAWRNPTVRLKDGTLSQGKRILIDGQQRVTALTAAILGQKVINKRYQKVKIKIAFNPITERFEVFNTAIAKDPSWLHDISTIISGDFSLFDLINQYCSKNPEVDKDFFFKQIEKLRQIAKKQIGLIELDGDLDIETVTEIFIRINSKGVVLSQADFAMSKIASNEDYNGSTLRKCIDYFCHLSIEPKYYNYIADADPEFVNTEYFSKIAWLKQENDDIYDPSYNDLLRVAFTSEFGRGKFSDLVSLLSGRNFETRSFEEEIAEESFAKLKKGVLNFINETNFKRFIMIIKSAGFIDASMIRSRNALNFAYVVYLKLKNEGYDAALIESYVRKWFVLALLTGRYSGSAESFIDLDIRNITSRKFEDYLQMMEAANLSDGFWNVGLVQQLESATNNSPSFNVYLAAQCKFNVRGFLSKEITIKNIIEYKGDIHHIFPKDYLRKNNFTQVEYNQIANYVYMQTEINIRIGNKAPNTYFSELEEQCNGGMLKYGSIVNAGDLKTNLVENDIPQSIFQMTVDNYQQFLKERRMLMANKIRKYYDSI